MHLLYKSQRTEYFRESAYLPHLARSDSEELGGSCVCVCVCVCAIGTQGPVPVLFALIPHAPMLRSLVRRAVDLEMQVRSPLFPEKKQKSEKSAPWKPSLYNSLCKGTIESTCIFLLLCIIFFFRTLEAVTVWRHYREHFSERV